MPRINIIQPESWLAAFRRAAAKAGVSLSEWIGNQCRDALPPKEAAKLGERPPANRPKKLPRPE